MSPDEIRVLGPDGWRRLLREGHPVAPRDLEGWAYRGISLGLPRAIERLTWTTFQKAFVWEPQQQLVRGWNVRLVQRGLQAPSEPVRDRRGEPVTFGHFAVRPARGAGVPHGFDRGLLLDYAYGARSPLDPLGRLRDPIVALQQGDPTRLLGWSYLEVLGRAIDTPSFFLLEREHRVTFVPRAPRNGYGR